MSLDQGFGSSFMTVLGCLGHLRSTIVHFYRVVDLDINVRMGKTSAELRVLFPQQHTVDLKPCVYVSVWMCVSLCIIQAFKYLVCFQVSSSSLSVLNSVVDIQPLMVPAHTIIITIIH